MRRLRRRLQRARQRARPRIHPLESFSDQGIKILSEGAIAAETIDEKKLIDQHYYAIASKATILKPNELNVPADKFEKQVATG